MESTPHRIISHILRQITRVNLQATVDSEEPEGVGRGWHHHTILIESRAEATRRVITLATLRLRFRAGFSGQRVWQIYDREWGLIHGELAQRGIDLDSDLHGWSREFTGVESRVELLAALDSALEKISEGGY